MGPDYRPGGRILLSLLCMPRQASSHATGTNQQHVQSHTPGLRVPRTAASPRTVLPVYNGLLPGVFPATSGGVRLG